MAFDPKDYQNTSSRSLGNECADCGEDAPKEELTFSPQLLYFPYLYVGGESEPRPFVISNTGDVTLGVSSVTVTGDFEITGNTPVQLAPGDAATFYVTFKPTVEGVRVGDVSVDAGTLVALDCVHLVGISNEDDLSQDIDALQGQITGLQSQITTLQELLDGFVKDKPVYMWRAYANSPDGTLNFTTGEPDGHTFIGLAFNKTNPVPSENPADYEWSSIGGSISNVIANDTKNVAGRPATQILTDIDGLAESMLAYEFDQQQLRDYVDGLMYVEGQPVNTIITTFKNEVQTDVEAMAEKLDIMGAVTPDGLGFILDLNKVYAGPDITFAMKLNNMVAETEAAQASVQTLQQAIAAENYAKADDLALIGAKTADGTAWSLNMNSVYVGADQTLSQYINTQVAAAAGNAASVEEVRQVVVDPVNGASAKALLQLDVNGHVVGYAATNSANFGKIVFTFDSFELRDPNGLSLFLAENGVVKMPNVEIDTLKVGSVNTDALAGTAIRKAYSVELVSSVGLPSAGTKTITTLSIVKDDGASDVQITWMMRMRPGVAYAGYFRLYEKIGEAAFTEIDQVWFWMPNVGLAGVKSIRTVEPYIRKFLNRPAGPITYRLDFTFYAADGSTIGFIEPGSGLYFEEIKR